MLQLVQTKHSAPPRIVIHGGEKIGKSTLCSQIPGVAFMPTEEGLRGLDTLAIIDPDKAKKRYETYDEFEQALQWGEMNLNAYNALCIDSADWLEGLIHQKIMKDYGVQSMGEAAGGYGKGYEEAMTYWRNILLRLDRLNAKGKWIVLICHSKTVEYNDPMHDNYDIHEMKLHASKKGQGALTLLKEWADVIAFAAREKFVSKSEGSDKMKANETTRRMLHLEGNASFVAGNRYGLPPVIDLSWSAFMAALRPDLQQQQQQPQMQPMAPIPNHIPS
jgi:hypothetical protein